MGTATVGVAQKEDEEERIDEQDIFDGVVSFLATITFLLFSRVVGADDAPFRPVMGTRGASGRAAGAPTMGASASSSGVTTVAASASEMPSRCARAMRERAVVVHGKPTSGPRFPVHPPRRHLALERGLEGRDQLLKLVKRHAREIQELHWTGLQLGPACA